MFEQLDFNPTPYFELRYNDGIINTHPDVISQVDLMQTRLKYYRCFGDLKIDGRYGDTTRKAVLLMKRRVHTEINDRCNAILWNYLTDNEVKIIPKPLEGILIPTIEGIETQVVTQVLAKLIAIPLIDKLNQNQIKALIVFSLSVGFDYGLPQFDPLNKALERGQIKNIPKVFRLYQNLLSQDFLASVVYLWQN